MLVIYCLFLYIFFVGLRIFPHIVENVVLLKSPLNNYCFFAFVIIEMHMYNYKLRKQILIWSLYSKDKNMTVFSLREIIHVLLFKTTPSVPY